jgi:hypothetical protein
LGALWLSLYSILIRRDRYNYILLSKTFDSYPSGTLALILECATKPVNQQTEPKYDSPRERNSHNMFLLDWDKMFIGQNSEKI